MPAMRHCLSSVWLLWLLWLLGTLAAQAQTALVVGNDAYTGQPLPQARLDAAALAVALRERGFQVIQRENLDRRGLLAALRELTERAATGAVLFYYVGQGLEVRRHTYLLPVGAVIHNVADLEREAVALAQVVQQMQQTTGAPRIIVVDVPRTDPLGSGALPSLPLPALPQGLIVWSTSPGGVPVSGVYARQLLAPLSRTELPLLEVFRDAWQSVVASTDGQQIPRDIALLDAQPPVPPPSLPTAALAPASAAAPVTTPYELHDRLQNGASGPTLVALPAGEFQLGSVDNERGRDSDEQARQMQLAAFAIGKYEVTFAEYDRFATTTGRARPDDRGWGRGNRPVINVSWEDAWAYADWLSTQTGQRYRLPTEAEWEYAARAGTTTAYAWGETVGKGNANCRGCGSRWDGRQTAPIASFAANAFGLHDMAGNVAEWTCSLYAPIYGGTELRCASPGEAGARVLRGDAWDGDVLGLRSANRARLAADFRTNNLGFRLARSL